MIPFPNLKVSAAGPASAVKFTTAGSGWTLSSDGLLATYASDSSGIARLAKANISRTTGPAAVAFKAQSGDFSTGGAYAVGIYPPAVATETPGNTEAIVWYSTGQIAYGRSALFGAGSTRSWIAGDTTALRLSDDGTVINFIRNGASVGSASVSAVSRVPAAYTGDSSWSVTINGAPAGETAWG